MKANVGGVDRLIRILLGIGLLVMFFTMEGGIRYVGLLGIVLIVTAFIRWCPLYLPFKINTKKN